MDNIKIYRNEDVEEIILAIPHKHYHVRCVIKFRDQTILLQEATLAALVRSYLSILLHPVKKGVILRKTCLSKEERKPGYAECQLIEVKDSEDKAIDFINKILSCSA